MRRAVAILVALVSLAAASSASAGTLSLQPVGAFVSPDYITSVPGHSGRLLVVEQRGTVQQVIDGVTSQFLDLRTEIGSITGERGLLSLAFDPADPLTFYVDYASAASGGNVTVARFHVNGSGALTSTAGETVLTVPHSSDRHNGGQLAFGPDDGLLYMSVGDNVDGASAQDSSAGTGKILRFDPNATSSFTSAAVWAKGLRNPWRFSFAPSGDLFIGDVGENQREEIDRIDAAALGSAPNFGWPCFEGTIPYSTSGPCATPPAQVAPLLDYAHVSGGMCGGAVTGGYVARGAAPSSLVGRYVFGDYCKGWIRSIDIASPADQRTEAVSVSKLSSFGEDAEGHLFAVSSGGAVSQIVETTPAPPVTGSPPGGSTGMGSPAGPGTTGQSTSLDLKAPTLLLVASARERVLRGGRLHLRGRCSEACRLRGRAWIQIAGHRRALALGVRAGSGKASQSIALEWRLSAAVRRSIAAALRAHRRVSVRWSVSGADGAGNASADRVRTASIVG